MLLQPAKIVNIFILIAVLFTVQACAQKNSNNKNKLSQGYTVMFYNVENLYDTKDDPLTDDNEFTPEGRIPWTNERLKTKLDHISQVFTDIAAPGLPDLIGLAEIENHQVLEMLTSESAIKKANYKIVHYDSRDERGIDVALLYNPDRFTVSSSEPLQVDLPGNDFTRDILYIKGKLSNGTLLHVFVNHWPSRREGTDVSEIKRVTAAHVLADKITQIRTIEKSPSIIIMGDFNDEPLDKSIQSTLLVAKPQGAYKDNTLYNLLFPVYANGEGSLYYKDWDLFDQIIVSGNLLNGNKPIKTSTDKAKVYKADYLLFKPRNGPAKPNRTMGERYFGGYSDHLPVFFNLN